MYALIDANNFFVSCERVFRPDLADVPVLVLSNNDGCVVSRSNEVKAAGIPMGAPRFQIETKIKKFGVECFSSNFRLYGDLSDRLMRLIRAESGSNRQEIYSIDECFVWLDETDEARLSVWARRLRGKISQGLGLPVSIGVAPSKTLAKLASEIIKSDPLNDGTLVLPPGDDERRAGSVREFPVGQVWGIGRATWAKLVEKKIDTAGKFMDMSREWVRANFGLGAAKTWAELHGTACIDQLEAMVSHRQILRSRSFGQAVTEKEQMQAAVSEFVTLAAEACRRMGARANMVTVFIRTSNFAPVNQLYGNSASVSLPMSSSNSGQLMSAAMRALGRIWQPGFAYKKAGVMLSGLEQENAWQPSLWLSAAAMQADERQSGLMKKVDQLNRRYGQRVVGAGWAGMSHHLKSKKIEQKWFSRATNRSPEYSTDWQHLQRVR